MSATAGLTVVATRTNMTTTGGQLTQIGIDPISGLRHVVGTCPWCGQTNVSLHSHMDSGGNTRFSCTSPTAGPFMDPNQSPLPANQKGAAAYKHR
jgi:hypothetical protein